MCVILTEIEDLYCHNIFEAFDQGQHNAFKEIINYMETKAKKLGFNLVDISPKTVKEIRKMMKLYNYTPDKNIEEILDHSVKGAKKYNIKGSFF